MWQYFRRGLWRTPIDRGAWPNRSTGSADQGNNGITQEKNVKKNIPCPFRRGLWRTSFDRGSWRKRTTEPADQGDNAIIQEKTVNKQVPCPFRIVPCILQAWQRHLGYFGTHPHNEKQSSGNHHSSSTKGSYSNVCDQQCAILGAVGWSGVLVLGWTILQPWYRHQAKRVTTQDFVPKQTQRYTGLHNLFLHPALTQPVNYSLPQLQNDQPISTPIQVEVTHEEIPISPEEKAFDDAAEQVRIVHERVIGEAENRRGVMCMSHGRHEEAVEHFRIASDFKNAPAAFNMGQCYELGIGIKQDFSEAAHWYKLASDMGHPTAMYNLGVFYAHGWGGLDADIKQARELFSAAASLGQPDAQAALSYERKLSDKKFPRMEILKDNESSMAVEFFNFNKLNLKLFKSNKKDSFNEVKSERLPQRPDSSLPNTPSPSTSLSSSPSSLVSLNEDPLSMFSHSQQLSSEDSSYSEMYSDSSSDNEWQLTANVADMNGNSTTLYRLAECYESSPAAEKDPELVLQLYRMASDHGHEKARRRLRFLEEHQSLGTLKSVLRKNQKKSKRSSLTECVFHQ